MSRTKYQAARMSFHIQDARKMGRELKGPSLVLLALAPFSSRLECENSLWLDTSFGSYRNACYAGKSKEAFINIIRSWYLRKGIRQHDKARQ